MKHFIFGLVLMAFILTATCALHQDVSCSPGSTFKLSCNTCICNFKGNGYACTIKGCLRKRSALPASTIFLSHVSAVKQENEQLSVLCKDDNGEAVSWIEPKNHKLGEKTNPSSKQKTFGVLLFFKKIRKEDAGTYTCKTIRGESAYFTLFVEELDLNPKCDPGSTKMIECNSCHCTDAGVWTCTKIGCLKLQKRPELNLNPKCDPGSTKMEECNSCHCIETGVWACTQMACPKLQKRSDEADSCTDGENKFDGCNHCNCYNGRWGCTLKACGDRINLNLNPKCDPGSTKMEECNSCHCTDDRKWQCTERGCLGVQKRSVQECKPMSHKQEGCNSCFCTETGVWICTKKGCHGDQKL